MDNRYSTTHSFSSAEYGIKVGIVTKAHDKLWEPGDLEHEDVLERKEDNGHGREEEGVKEREVGRRGRRNGGEGRGGGEGRERGRERGKKEKRGKMRERKREEGREERKGERRERKEGQRKKGKRRQ